MTSQNELTAKPVAQSRKADTSKSIKPEFIRLPKPGTLCPHTGLSRSKLNELILGCPTNEFIPSGADRILKMVEAQSSHRIELEKSVLTSQQRQETRGQWFGLIIAIFFGSCRLCAAHKGQAWFGGVISDTTLVSLVGIFVYSRRQSQKELSEKRKTMALAAPPQSNQPPSQGNRKKRDRK